MNTDHDRAEELLNQALALGPDQRAAFLAAACGSDKALQEKVESLLKAYGEAGGFLPETPAVKTALPAEGPGTVIDKYKLLEKLGEGGCGIVYMAEQEEPVRRKVALKVIKLGMDTKQVVGRFEAERQALALMDHANIAKVLDAGATDTGRPYFVMELVGGVRITDYCNQKNLTTRQRLGLFIQVCHAVQHAHQKGVIHRDLKPSNVLVAEQDGTPIPKVIDFGIAKATQGRLTDQTIFTAFEQFLGTPAYMSPEQAQVGSLDVDTRSDIYSLGVLLYELLTGKTPFDAKELLAVGLDAMRRTICEKEPPTPSTRLAQERRANHSTVQSKSEIVDRKPEIDRDLDWIVMKCLEKDRARRYETANGLARDIERHLNDEPVVASPPSRLYRFQKMVRRNRATAVVAAILIVCATVSTWQAVRATRAKEEQIRLRTEAQKEAAKSDQVARLLKEMLEGVGPSKALGRDTTMLREILDRTAERIGKQLTNQPEVEIELRAALADTYFDLGLFSECRDMAAASLRLARAHFGQENEDTAHALYQLSSAEMGLGNLEPAETSAQESVKVARKLFGAEDEHTAKALANLGMTLFRRSKPVEAEAAVREALDIQRKLNSVDGVATCLESFAYVLSVEGKLADAETTMREAVALRKRLVNPYPLGVAVSLNELAGILFDRGKLNEAETNHIEALSIERKLLGNDHLSVANVLGGLANVQEKQSRLAEAEATHREALAIYRKLDNQPGICATLGNLAVLLASQNRLPEAEEMIREALALNRKLHGNEHPDVAYSLNTLGAVLDKQSRFKEAIEPLREAVAILRNAASGDASREPPLLGMASANLALMLSDEGNLAEARPLAEEAVKLFQRHADWSPYDRTHAERVLVQVLLATGETSEAEKNSRQLLEGLMAGKPPNDPELARAVLLQATILDKQGKLDEAEKLYWESLPAIRTRLPPNDPKLTGALAHFCTILLSDRKFAEAEPLARECLDIRQATFPDHWLTFSTRCQVGASLLGQQKYSEAESFLLSGYDGMKQREETIWPQAKSRVRDALKSLVQLYEAKGESDRAAEWRTKLEEFGRAQTDNRPTATPAGAPPH